MTLHRITCFVADCDDCHIDLDCEDLGYIIHFATDHQALDHLVAQGWTVTEDGGIRCPPCTREYQAQQPCHSLRHVWSDWKVCACHGAIGRHRHHGCPLVRACAQCGALDEATLALLPTTDGPTDPGC